MLDFVPDPERFSKIFDSAIAPSFFLGAVAAFAALMTSRMNDVLDRIRTLNAISDADLARAHLKDDLVRLLRRANLLKDGLLAVLGAGISSTVLLAVMFATEFLGLSSAYGAGLLFLIATILLGVALYKFAQEARISLDEADNY